jgi:hypothetical protein
VTTTATSRPARSGLAGIVTVVAVPVALVLAAITVVGLPLSLAGVAVSLPLLWVAYVYGALVTGRWLLSLGNVGQDSGLVQYVGVTVGLLVAAVAAFVPFGGLVTVVYLVVGLGAFALSALALRRGRSDGDGEDSTGRNREPAPDADRDPEVPEPTTGDDTDGDAGVPPA